MNNIQEKEQILVVVDYQGDFVNGVLPVPGAESIAQNIQVEINNSKYSHIIYTFDTHTQVEYETSEEKELFPDIHCEFKTDGWRFFEIQPQSNEQFSSVLNGTDAPFKRITIGKESFFTKNKFDIFEGNDIYENWLIKNFPADQYDVVVVGVATNYCVASHVMGLANRGYNVTIKDNAVKGITNFPDGTVDPSYDERINEMISAGVVFEGGQNND